MIPNAPHQKLIDGLGVLVLENFLTKAEAWEIIKATKNEPDELDESILWQVMKDCGYEPN